MLLIMQKDLDNYIQETISESWKMRDFVCDVQKYINSKSQKVFVVSGLRGVGKTVGLLQAIKGKDAVYLSAQALEVETSQDYIALLKTITSSIVVIDEYSWISDREELDKYLFILVQNGKRVIITGTESVTLEYLKYGALIHRTEVKHVTYFSYEEFCRVNSEKPSLQVCEKYLREGGLFKDYTINTYSSMKQYVKTAIIDNLVAYCSTQLDRSVITVIVYTILYKAVCDSTVKSVPVLKGDWLSLVDFLDLMEADVDLAIEASDFNEIATILETIGVVVKVQNYRIRSEYRTYIVNPSITYQLIKCIYKLDTVDRGLMGYVFESSCVCALYFSKQTEHQLYYAEGRKSGIDFEIDVAIIDNSYSHNRAVWLFECKLSENTVLPARASLVSDTVDSLFADNEIQGRYVVYNGVDREEIVNGKPVIYTNTLDCCHYTSRVQGMQSF